MKRTEKGLANAMPEKSVERGWRQEKHTRSDGSEWTSNIYSAKLDDFEGNIILSDHELIMGGKVVVYPSRFAMENDIPMCLRFPDRETIVDFEPLGVTLREARAEDPDGKSIEQCIRDAVRYVTDNDRFWGSPTKTVENMEPLFVMEAYGLQDCLFYAMEDLPHADPDELFDYFIHIYGYEWWMKAVGIDTAISILREFFDNHPKVQRK